MQKKISGTGARLLPYSALMLYVEMGIEEKEVIRRTPEETGRLRGTIKRIGPKIEGNSASVLIVAGGPDAPYAPDVHEDLDAIHPVGQAKFLESVLMESRPFIGARVAKRVDLGRLAGEV